MRHKTKLQKNGALRDVVRRLSSRILYFLNIMGCEGTTNECNLSYAPPPPQKKGRRWADFHYTQNQQINVCVHLLYEILSKLDVKYTKYELNIIYVCRYSTAVTRSLLMKPYPVQRHQLDIYTDFCPNRMKKM